MCGFNQCHEFAPSLEESHQGFVNIFTTQRIVYNFIFCAGLKNVAGPPVEIEMSSTDEDSEFDDDITILEELTAEQAKIARAWQLGLNPPMPEELYNGARLGQKWTNSQCWNLVSEFGSSRYSRDTPIDKKSWPLRRYAKVVDCRPTFEVDKGEDRYRIDTILQKVQARWPHTNSKYITMYAIRWLGWNDDFNSVEPEKYIDEHAVALFEREQSDVITGSRGATGNGWAKRSKRDLDDLKPFDIKSSEAKRVSHFKFVEDMIDAIEERTEVPNVRLCGVGM